MRARSAAGVTVTTSSGLPAVSVSPSVQSNPRLSQWVQLVSDGRVAVRSGKVELGQGVLTALAQVAAEELGVDVSRVDMLPATTAESPDESYTSGSLSVVHSGGALRQVCAEVRTLFVEAAAGELAVSAADLHVNDGRIETTDGRGVTYWDLAPAVTLDRETSGAITALGSVGHRTVGTSVPRLDLPDKVLGRPVFIHDLRSPGQLYGRVVRAPARAATLRDLDTHAVDAMSGVVCTVVDGSFLGVVAEREDVAVRAAAALAAACSWDEHDSLPDEGQLVDMLTSAPATTSVLIGEPDDERPVPATTHVARFSRPYLAHASMGPSCGVALWDEGVLRVWSHSQGVYKLRQELSRQCGLDPSAVVVEHAQGAGCYGHNGADDAAYDAVILARAVPGRSVQVVWSRQDELSWSPFGPAMAVQISVGLDAAGEVTSWDHEIWSNGHTSRPGGPQRPPLLSAMQQDPPATPVVATDPPTTNGGGSGRNGVPLYDLPHVRVRSHRLDVMPLRTSAMRALGAHLNVFAIEQVIDDLALRADVDPVDYRVGLLRDPRAVEVLRAVAQRSGWRQRPLPHESSGRGIGFARYKNNGAYCAVVATVVAEERVTVADLTIAVDVGLAINPDGVVNQIEGGALQALSWTLKEAVRFDRARVTSDTWDDYPILTFSEAPPVDVVLVGPADAPPLGAGEASMGPTAAAIGNALHDALHFRVRDLPLTAEQVMAAMP